MERVPFLIVYIMTCYVQSFPVDNGVTIKFKPILVRQDLELKNAGNIFSRAPLDAKLNEDTSVRELFSTLFFTQSTEAAPTKSTMFPKRSKEHEGTEKWTNNAINFINLPIITQLYDDYKVLVATAPPNVDIGSSVDKKKMVVYVVFPNDESNGEPKMEEIPKIYFVKGNSVKRKMPKKEEMDPILIIDSNRTVTGLKSKEVPKFVRFKNKLTSRLNYTITS